MTPRTFALRAETSLLVVILAVVAVSAGWASFSHVHDWTMRHVPPGTPDAFGWVNAVISELVPVAAFLTIRRRLRARQSIGYPLFLLVASAAFSLAAQLAVANPSPSGWLLSAVPALAFMALVKLVFSSLSTTGTAPATATRMSTPQQDKPTSPPTREPVNLPQQIDRDPQPVRTPEPVAPQPEPAHVDPVDLAPVDTPADLGPPLASPAVPPTAKVPARPAVQMPHAVLIPPRPTTARMNGHIVSGVIR